ncbi:MAG: formimidoylglutamate deiminase [Candidatus Phosphoribacter sp.]
MTSFWAEHVWLPTGLARGVRLVVADGRFLAVETKANRGPDDVRLRGVVFPGMVNAHSHVFQRALRGRTQSDGDNGVAWRAKVHDIAQRLNPDLYLALARATFAEMALAGFTTVGEFHYLHHGPGGSPYADPNAMSSALVKAASEVGIRLTLLDTLYLRGGLTSEGHLPLEGVQERFSDGSVDTWAERMSRVEQTELLRHGAAIHSIRAVPKEQAAYAAQVAGERPLHAYVSEHPAENLACEMFYGQSPTELFAEAGVLGPEFTAVHATALSESDLDLLADTECQVVACPTSERDMAGGVPHALRLLDAGLPVGIGSDHQAFIDPWLELRELEMHERSHSGERGRISTAELVKCGSLHGARSLGWYDTGAIAPGLLADFVTVDLESLRTAGSKAAEVLYTANAADVLTVVVGGRMIVEDGQHSFGPIAPLMSEALFMLRDSGCSRTYSGEHSR